MGTFNPGVDQKPATAWYDDFQSPKIFKPFQDESPSASAGRFFDPPEAQPPPSESLRTWFCIVFSLFGEFVFVFALLFEQWWWCFHLPSSPKASFPYPPATQRFPASKLAQGLGRQIGAMCSALWGWEGHHFMKWFHKKSFFYEGWLSRQIGAMCSALVVEYLTSQQ